MIDMKIQFFEDNFLKLTVRREPPETKEMLHASSPLYKYTLPVYKNSCLRLAKGYHNNASKENIQAPEQAIHDKQYSGFKVLSTQLTVAGKIYAKKNHIKVNWGK